MKKTILALLLTLTAGSPVLSQQFRLGLSGGLGTYAMDDLRSLNDVVHPDFDSKLVSDFPAYLYYQPSMSVKLDRFTLGLNYTYQSTGSRISAKDYSGEYRFDMAVHSNNLGIVAAKDLFTGKKTRLSMYLKPGMSFSALKINEYLQLFTTVEEDETIQLKASSIYAEPGIDFGYALTPSLGLGLNLGYYVQVASWDFHLDGEKDMKITNPETGDTIKPGWKGFRFGITLMYTINPEGEQSAAVQPAK